MILFVGLAENSELAGAVVSEQIDEIKRALDIAFGAILNCVSTPRVTGQEASRGRREQSD
jgi:hypothetical protein